MITRRFGMIVGLLGMSLTRVPAGHADDEPKKACAAAYTNAQRAMRTGSLIQARKQLVLCGGPACPEAMQADCQQWLTKVEDSTPTVVFQVAAADAPPPKDVMLMVDSSEPVPFDGRAVAVDPGEHDITFTASGYRTTTVHLVVSEGERLRRQAVVLARAGEDDVRTSRVPTGVRAAGFTLPVLVTASVAALAGISAAYFGIRARVDDHDLDRCEPTCTKETVDKVSREYLLTNLSLGVAAVGLSTAAVLYFVQGRPAAQPATTVGIGAGPAGFGPMITGRF